MRLERLWISILALASPACLGASPEVTSNGSSKDAAADSSEVEEVGPPLCGGKDCLGGACVDDVCQPVTLAPPEKGNSPTMLVVEPGADGSIFYTTFAGLQVRRVGKNASTPETLSKLASPFFPLGLDSDGEMLFVTTFDSYGFVPVYSMQTDGKNRKQLGDRAFQGPWGIVHDGAYVYWTNRYDNDEIVRAPKSGGPHEVLLHKDKTSAEEEELYGIALDGDDLYFSLYPLYIGKMPKTGGPVVQVCSALAAGVAVDATHVYWSELFSVRRAKKDGSGEPELIAENDGAVGIGLSDGYVYFMHYGHPPNADGEVRRWKIDTHGPVETIATKQRNPNKHRVRRQGHLLGQPERWCDEARQVARHQDTRADLTKRGAA